MSGKKFNAGLLAGVLLTIGVLAVVAAVTLNAKAALRLSNSDFDLSASAGSHSELPELGEVSFNGIIDTINADSYVVSGLTFRFDMQTILDAGLQAGDTVEVKALMLPDQTRYALSIQLEDGFDAAVGATFEFHGIVESTGNPGWVISGENVQVDATTMVDAGVAVDSLVEVKGLVIGTNLMASSIELKDGLSGDESSSESDEVKFTGTIESISGGTYVIGGKTVLTDPATEIKDVLAEGDFVKVEAVLQMDGTYLALEIEKEDISGTEDDSEEKDGKLEITGLVDSISGTTWVIDGITILVDPMTAEIEGNPQVGDQVKVEAFLQADGVTYLAHEIKLTDGDEEMDDDQSEDSDEDQDDDQDEDQDDDQDEDHDEDQDDDEDEDDSGHEESRLEIDLIFVS